MESHGFARWLSKFILRIKKDKDTVLYMNNTSNKNEKNWDRFDETNLMGIPVWIKNDDRVCGLEIQSQTSSSSTEKEKKVITVWAVEFFQQVSSIFSFGCSI